MRGSPHLGRLDLTLIKFDGCHAREEIPSDLESAIRVKPVDLAFECRERPIHNANHLAGLEQRIVPRDRDVADSLQLADADHIDISLSARFTKRLSIATSARRTAGATSGRYG